VTRNRKPVTRNRKPVTRNAKHDFPYAGKPLVIDNGDLTLDWGTMSGYPIRTTNRRPKPETRNVISYLTLKPEPYHPLLDPCVLVLPKPYIHPTP
jgi:hypothetical protein